MARMMFFYLQHLYHICCSFRQHNSRIYSSPHKHHFMFKIYNFSTIIILSVFLFNFSANAQSWKWAKGSTGTSDFEGLFCATDYAGNVYATGFSAGDMSLGSYSFLTSTQVLAKYDNSGNLKWVVNTGVKTDPDGLVTDAYGYEYLMGVTGASFTMGGRGFTMPPGVGNCYFIAKVDSFSNVIWIKSIGDIDGGLWGYKLLAIGQDGNLYVTCLYDNTPTLGSYTLANPGSIDQIAVVKLDSSGSILWAKGFTAPDHKLPTGITVSPSGSIYITGYFQSDTMMFGPYAVHDTAAKAPGNNTIYITKLDAGGNVVWATAAGGSNQFEITTAIAADDTGVYITGYYSNATITFGPFTLPVPYKGTDAYGFLTRYDPSGNAVWAKVLRALFTSHSYPTYMLALDQCHNIWLSGSYGDASGIDTVDGRVWTCPPGSSLDPMVLAAWSSGGTMLNYTALTSGGDDFTDIAMDRFGKIFIEADYYIDTMIVGNDTLTDPGISRIEHNFVACYYPELCAGKSPLIQAENIQQGVPSLQLYPNPATRELVAVYNDDIKEIVVQNITGKTVFCHTYSSHGKHVAVNVATLPTGMYFIKVNNLSIGKFMKE